MHGASARRNTVSCLVALCLMGSACGSQTTSTGTLVIPFQLGNRRTCDALGVKTVRAELDDAMYVSEAPCSNGQVRFKELAAGSYHVRLFGVDGTGVAVMDSVESGKVVVNVIGEDATVVVQPAVILTAAPAHLLVRWNFGFGTCKGVGVDRFAVRVWHKDGDELLLDATLPCSAEGDGEEQYRSVPDVDRQLGGGEVGEVSIQPLDKTGIAVGEAVVFRFDAPGPGHDIKLSLNCSEGACSSTGKPD
jgi:hypothetical protein